MLLDFSQGFYGKKKQKNNQIGNLHNKFPIIPPEGHNADIHKQLDKSNRHSDGLFCSSGERKKWNLITCNSI